MFQHRIPYQAGYGAYRSLARSLNRFISIRFVFFIRGGEFFVSSEFPIGIRDLS